MNNKFDAKAEILKKFGKLQVAAEKLGISQSTLSKNLDRLTPEFIERLKGIGVNIIDSNVAGGDNVIQSFGSNDAELKRLREENKQLREDIVYFKDLVKTLSKQSAK